MGSGVQDALLAQCRHFFSFNDPAPTEIYTLSLHDALPISPTRRVSRWVPPPPGMMPRLISGCPDRKSTRLNSSHVEISYAVFCLKKKTDSDVPERLHAVHASLGAPVALLEARHAVLADAAE